MSFMFIRKIFYNKISFFYRIDYMSLDVEGSEMQILHVTIQ
jgi:hypothetical protein